MVYMQKGNYVAVVNPLSYSEVMSDDSTLAYGIYDTVTGLFFPSVIRPIYKRWISSSVKMTLLFKRMAFLHNRPF
jgi:sensor c-di-GMP phosphodiesterase-like protein